MTLTIVSRARWGARHDRGFRPAPLPASEVWLHHTVTIAPDLVHLDADRDGVDDDEARAMRTLEDIGEQRFGGGISYTFAVMPSGRVYEGHGVDREGAHTAGRNSVARSIVLVGDYSRHAVTEAQVRAVAALLRLGVAEGWWQHAQLDGGHQDAPGARTECPARYGMAAIPRINKLAAAGTNGGFLMSLTKERQDQVARAADRVLGITNQRYWNNTTHVEVPASQARDAHGRLRPGVEPVPLLDALDGAHLARRVGELTELVRELADRLPAQGGGAR